MKNSNQISNQKTHETALPTTSPTIQTTPAFLSAYDKKPRVTYHDTTPSRTKQSFAAECDINTIMKRYERTGVLDHVAQRAPRYEDVVGLNFGAAMDVIVGAKNMFADLPAQIRDRFNNDPETMLEFIQNEENRAEAAKMGLLRVSEDSSHPPINPTVKTQPAASTQAAAASGEGGKGP